MNKINYPFRALLFVLLNCLLSLSQLYAEPFAWSPSSVIDSSTSFGLNDATSCYDQIHNRTFSAWVDANTSFPVYSIYSNGSWSSPAVIDPSMTSVAQNNVFLCHDTQGDRIFAAWNDPSNNNYPTFSIYSNGSWSIPSPIDTSIDVLGGDVFLCYNSINNQVFATWAGDLGAPTFSIYNSGVWSAAAAIDAGGTLGLNVYTCFNSQQNQIIATWADINNNDLPTYSIYNGSSWSPAASISVNGITLFVFPTYNSLTNEVIATWVDDDNFSYPTYSIYNGSVWTNPAVIVASTVEGVGLTLFTCYDSLHNQIFAAWPTDPECSPVYSIFSEGVWSPLAYINVEPPGVLQNIFLSYNSTDDDVMATWTDCISFLPYFSIYSDTASPLLPPINLAGCQLSNRFATQTEYYNALSWSAPLSGAMPSFYRIYRQNLNTLIGIVPANAPLQFEDHNLRRQTYTYYITSVDANGNESLPAIMTVSRR